MKPLVVVFDWDGTVIDSLEIKIRNAAELFHQQLGIPVEQVEASYRRNSGVARRQLFEAICGENNLPPLTEELYQRLSVRFSTANLEVIGAASPQDIVPRETWSALETLQERGHPLYVSTASDQNEVRALAKNLGLDGYFKEILGSSPGFSKGRQHIEYICQQQSTSAEQVVMVGDEPADVQLGQAAGVKTIAKAGTHPAERLWAAGADFVVATLSELPAILEKIQKTVNNGDLWL